MKTINATYARSNIYKLMSEIIKSHKPVQVTGKPGDIVMLSVEDWNSIQETLYLDAIPGMTDSIVEGMNTKEEDCETELDW